MVMEGAIDVGHLRKALRLVHCLQKERGASCSYHASLSVVKRQQTVEPARRETDRALRKASLCMESHCARTVLEKIRKSTEQKDVSYHRILATYNCMISTVIHEGITKHTSSKKSISNGGPASQAGAMKRVSSYHTFDDLSSDVNLDKKKKGRHHRRLTSDNGVDGPRVRCPTDPDEFITFKENQTMDPSLLDRIDSLDNFDHEKPRVTFEERGDERVEETVEEIVEAVEETVETSDNLSNLLTLLETFVALTESTGVERATLCSIVEVGGEAQHLRNDLILEVENQRRLVDTLLRCKCGSSMRNLVKDLVTMSPLLEDLQQRILTGQTSRVQQDFNSDRLWNLLTVYIDKLHSVELLILEEIEYAMDDERVAIQPVGDQWNQVFGEYGTVEKLHDIVASRSPSDVKNEMLSLLRREIGKRESEQREAPESTIFEESRLDTMLKELSSAPQSKEWEIDLYQIRFKKRIGQGAAGTTYLADWGGANVAVKVASITEMGLEGWRTEVQALQKLHHPNIIRLMGSVYHPSPLTFCLVLEYCDAGDLDTALQRVTPKNFVPHVSMSIAKAMTYLHGRGIIHRDIKPLNVLLNGDVGSGQFEVKVTDFGVATELTQGGDRTAETGTYRWMVRGRILAREESAQTCFCFSL
jgi:hypothetical protein